jgi:hypothetical protein
MLVVSNEKYAGTLDCISGTAFAMFTAVFIFSYRLASLSFPMLA